MHVVMTTDAATGVWSYSLTLAAALLSGSVEPPRSFQKAAPTSFVERSKASRRVGADGRPLQPETNLTRIVDLQSDFGGLVGRILVDKPALECRLQDTLLKPPGARSVR